MAQITVCFNYFLSMDVKETIISSYICTLLFHFSFCCTLADKDNQLCGKLSYQQLGVAKLSAFREWLSLHPLLSGSDYTGEEIDEDTSSTKMVIFAHHHKVLDGIQVSMLHSLHQLFGNSGKKNNGVYICLLLCFVLVLKCTCDFCLCQEFICDKGIGFVRIDGKTLPRDRQLAVQSFQYSSDVCTISP